MKRLPDEPRNEVPLKAHGVLLQENGEDEALGGAREGEFEVEVRNALVRAAAEKERARAAMASAAALDKPTPKQNCSN